MIIMCIKTRTLAVLFVREFMIHHGDDTLAANCRCIFDNLLIIESVGYLFFLFICIIMW